MNEVPEEFCVLREAFLLYERGRAFVELRPPIPLDAAHRSFLEQVLLGGRSVREMLDAVPPSCFADATRPSHEAVLQRLTAADSFLLPIVYDGPRKFARIAIDSFSGELLPRELVRDFLCGVGSDAPAAGEVLYVGNDPPEGLPAHARWLQFETRKSAPLSSIYRLLQFLRHVLLYVEPTNLLVGDCRDAAFLHDAIRRHRYALALRGPAAPFVYSGCFLERDDSRSSLQLYLDQLYWLRKLERASQLVTGALESTAVAIGGWRAMRHATVLLLEEPSTEQCLAVRGRWLPARRLELKQAGSAQVFEGLRNPRRRAPRRVKRFTILSSRERGPAERRAIFACFHLLGDMLCCTPALHAFRLRHPELHVTFLAPDAPHARVLELSPDIDRLAYVAGVPRNSLVMRPSVLTANELAEFHAPAGFRHVFDVQMVARQNVSGAGMHIAEGFARRLGVRIESRRPVLDLARAAPPPPELHLPHERYVVLSRHSVSGRGLRRGKHAKSPPESTWRELARSIRQDFGLAVISIGAASERPLEIAGVRDVHGLDIRAVAGLLRRATAFLTVDNGVYHLSQAMGTPTVHLAPLWLPADWTRPCAETPHVRIREDLAGLRAAPILESLRELLARLGGEALESLKATELAISGAGERQVGRP
jgi:ADP-heptose:LPS heptosyltransferase